MSLRDCEMYERTSMISSKTELWLVWQLSASPPDVWLLPGSRQRALALLVLGATRSSGWPRVVRSCSTASVAVGCSSTDRPPTTTSSSSSSSSDSNPFAIGLLLTMIFGFGTATGPGGAVFVRTGFRSRLAAVLPSSPLPPPPLPFTADLRNLVIFVREAMRGRGVETGDACREEK
uniref:Uncharacterized protein n=1 Tax=Anopheles farauti TaxID=69004 RepID=A0A182Q8J9_9DIPT